MGFGYNPSTTPPQSKATATLPHKQNGGTVGDMGELSSDSVSTSSHGFHKAVLYVLGEKTQMKVMHVMVIGFTQ